MKRDNYWDIVKGLGIIAVVLGHAGIPITPYIYMYHLSLFFFVAGYMYQDKYSLNPFSYLGNRLEKLWYPMIKYGILYCLLHNLFLFFDIYSVENISGVQKANYYTILDYFLAIKGTILMQTLEPIGGAMWFIIPLFFGMCLFNFIRYFLKNNLCKFLNFNRHLELIMSICIITIYIIGIKFNVRKINLDYYLDLTMLILPIIYSGFLVKKIWNKNLINKYIGILSFLGLILMHKIFKKNIELSQKEIVGPFYFLITSFMGIYFNLFLSKILEKYSKISKIIEYIGKRSFHIMALHFLMFKLANYIYVLFYNLPNYWIAKFPIIDSKWWYIYGVFGVGGPLIIEKILSNYRGNKLNIKSTLVKEYRRGI